MALLDLLQEKAFLGPEFVTWLWYRSETEEGTAPLPGGGACAIEFLKNLQLGGDFGEATASNLRGESPSAAPEAAAALLAGKLVHRAKIALTQGETRWELTLDALKFDWSALKLEVPKGLAPQEALPLRLEAAERFQELFTALFASFLEQRLDEDAWQQQLAAQRDWVRRKTETPEDEN